MKIYEHNTYKHKIFEHTSMMFCDIITCLILSTLLSDVAKTHHVTCVLVTAPLCFHSVPSKRRLLILLSGTGKIHLLH
jgi:hypothetical protein